MQVRRCAFLTLESRERLEFDLALLGDGGDGLRLARQWFALLPPDAQGIALSADEVEVLGTLSPTQWIDIAALAVSPAVTQMLLAKGLIIGKGSSAEPGDQRLRDTHWRGIAAAQHYASRWHGIDTEDIERRQHERHDGHLLTRLGPAPDPVHEHAAAVDRMTLPRPESSALEQLLSQRVTCRNFDRTRVLTLSEFATVLFRAYAARAVYDFAPQVPLLKKGVPSAGGLHATEAYVLVQRVAGLAPGLYHYHPVDHALEPMRALHPDEAATLARTFVAAQAYFADVHAMVIPTVRFRRNFWKYRDHAKAYRATILDIGHLSQTLYLAATELGLGAFITAAINEVDIEQAFGLDPLELGPLAVSGFGVRARERSDVEFDPLHAVWPAE